MLSKREYITCSSLDNIWPSLIFSDDDDDPWNALTATIAWLQSVDLKIGKCMLFSFPWPNQKDFLKNSLTLWQYYSQWDVKLISFSSRNVLMPVCRQKVIKYLQFFLLFYYSFTYITLYICKLHYILFFFYIHNPVHM